MTMSGRVSQILVEIDRELARINAARERKSTLPEKYDHLSLNRGKLRTPEGELPVKKIGGGLFAEVYREQGGRGRVFALTDDDVYDKDLYAEMRDSNPHVPAVDRYGSTWNKKVFVMPFYRAPLRKKDSPKAWEEFRVLKDCHDAVSKPPTARPQDSGYERNMRVVDCAQDRLGDRPVVQALDDLVSYASNFSTECRLEITPRNLATDEAGNLVLLDVLYEAEVARKKLVKKQQGREIRRLR